MYNQCRDTEKRNVSIAIVTAIRAAGGRFLQQRKAEDTNKVVAGTTTWCEIGDPKAVEKTLQALREKEKQQQQTTQPLPQPNGNANDNNTKAKKKRKRRDPNADDATEAKKKRKRRDPNDIGYHLRENMTYKRKNGQEATTFIPEVRVATVNNQGKLLSVIISQSRTGPTTSHFIRSKRDRMHINLCSRKNRNK